jgi:hypothetical protein
MPSSPERAKVVESTATEDTVSHFSEENPSGLEELQTSRTATNTARRARNPENTSPGLVKKLPTVPKTTEGEDKENMEEWPTNEMAWVMICHWHQVVKPWHFHLS